MKTILDKLYQTKSGDSLSSDECQQINLELGNLTVDEIPEDERNNVSDYLITALNHQSVEPQLVPKLDTLLRQLQEST